MRIQRLFVAAAAAAAIAVTVPAAAGTPTPGATTAAVAKAPATRCGAHPWCNTALSPSKRAHMLLAAMSLSDKVSLLSLGGTPSLGLPSITATDGALGAGGTGSGGHDATAMPAGIALAATFDPRSAYVYGRTVGVEVKHRAFDIDYGPTVNIMRTPLGGRTFEGYGEDPFLVAQQAVGWIKGFQSEGVMAEVKHFALNNQEGQLGVAPLSGLDGGRVLVNSVVAERSMHEIYLRAFQAAVQQGHSATVMCSYNQINGVYACANHLLLTTILRKEWGFKGAVFSDAAACHEPNRDLAAGMNVDIIGTCYTAPEVDAELAAGLINVKTLDERDFELLRVLFVFGFFDHPQWPNNPRLDNVRADGAVAERIEEEGAVLLRNERDVLPLTRSDHSIAVIGPAANHYIRGGGSSQVRPWFTITPLAGIESRAKQAGAHVTYSDGSSIRQAVALAKRSSVAIVVAADGSSEGVDKPCMSLRALCAGGQTTPPALQSSPLTYGNQDRLISAVAAANPHTVVVLEAGAPVLTPWRNQIAGLLEAWYPGEAGGAAIAHLLYGDDDPSGRLPVTFPKSASQLPTAGSAAQYPGTINPQSPLHIAAHYSEGVMVGYRWYDEHHLTPAYPFGFGLDYTSFRYNGLAVTRHGAKVLVRLTVTNTGRRAGWAVPEVYVGLPSAPGRDEPPHQLAGVAKLRLAPGASKRVRITLDKRDFAYWSDAANGFRVARGCDTVSVGSSSRDLPLSAVVSQHGAACAGAIARDRRGRRATG